MKKSGLMQETMSTRKTKAKEEVVGGRKKRRNMIGYQFILKKPSIGDVVSMSSVYMIWQV